MSNRNARIIRINVNDDMRNPVIERIDHIAVIGLGLVGASLAAALTASRPDSEIFGIDISPDTLKKAIENGWVSQAMLPDDPEFEQFIKTSCEMVVLATPVDAAKDYLKMLATWEFQGIITDTASTKTGITAFAQDVLVYPERYIPGHPMAGSEKNGIEGARIDLFQGTYWILCPDEMTVAQHFSLLHELLTGVGARVIALPRQDHDSAVAIVSHVPHIVASALVQLASKHADEKQTLFRLAAGGFKDSTRIAAGSPQLWCGISLENSKALRAGLSELQEILGNFEQSIAEKDKEKLTVLLRESADARRSLPSAWVPSTENLLEVRIPMKDRKGVVAEVTTIASRVGCNIQSIEIDHITEDSAVLSLIFTDEGDIGAFSTELIKVGFSVSFSPLGPKEHVHVD